MVGQPVSGEGAASWQAAQRAAGAASNLEVHGFVEHARVDDFLREAALFVHTSPAEGFPMTLLEAWSHGIPTVTAVDPGGTIERHSIGEVVTTLEGLTEAVARMMSTPDAPKSHWREGAALCRRAPWAGAELRAPGRTARPRDQRPRLRQASNESSIGVLRSNRCCNAAVAWTTCSRIYSAVTDPRCRSRSPRLPGTVDPERLCAPVSAV